ncbi:hypothetical protein SAMN02745244_02497 [Tessaracoccus bendigoensis DSM 12906]|uniref:Uncharacterized protein n=1 Tax=Tessaracoccus bendigoensis DSM 12906 TaxID=1123357 RepID=A0A1M6J9G9_9ACTN|nr:hypothetical protein SAMN02745244_02497 [Tessaracoccus bendigoensis DSM 12906]
MTDATGHQTFLIGDFGRELVVAARFQGVDHRGLEPSRNWLLTRATTPLESA